MIGRISRFRRGCGGEVPMVTTKNVCANRSVGHIVSLKTSNIRLKAHFIAAARYSTSSTFGRDCIGTRRGSVRVVGDPIKVPNETVRDRFLRGMGTKVGRPGIYPFGYVGAYSVSQDPCYVMATLCGTFGKGFRGNCTFTKDGT